MKNSYVIGIVWTAVVVCVISFGATVYFLDNNSKEERLETNSDDKSNKEQESVYQTDESSIRTNNYAGLDEINNDVISKNTTENTKEIAKNNNKYDMKNTINEELITGEEEKITYETEESVESISKNIESFIRPVKGDVLNPLSVNELVYSKTLQEWNVHTGIDYDAQLGDEVYSVNDGKIKEIKYDYAYGNYIVVEHDSGYESKYSNITVLDALKVGNILKQGQLIGYVAESFGFEVAEETHLHFELTKDGEHISL